MTMGVGWIFSRGGTIVDFSTWTKSGEISFFQLEIKKTAIFS